MLNSFYNFPSPSTVATLGMAQFSLKPKDRQGIRSWRYYDGTIYRPVYGFQFEHPFIEWDEEKDGPRPVVVPIPKRIVEIGAQALFGECPRFLLAQEEEPGNNENELQELIDEILRQNQMEDKYLPEARACAVEGETHFKFAWTPEQKHRPVAIMTLSAKMVTYYRDAIDSDIVTKARIQFKYCDEDGKWWWYREEWTPTQFLLYKRLETEENSDRRAIDGMNQQGRWPIEKSEVNPFGLIPITTIYNRKLKGDTEGYGDYWDIFDKLDQYNTTHWLEHHSNQLDGDPATVFINCSHEGAVDPHSIISVSGIDAKVERLPAGNALRDNIREFKQDLRKEIFDAVGYDDVDPAAITNKGSLTRAVFELVFAKTIKTTDEKRRHWGECGLCAFVANMLLGLSRLPDAVRKFPALKKVVEDDTKTYFPSMVWNDLFRVTPEERGSTLKDIITSIDNGFLTRERAIEITSDMWGISDVTALLEELKETHERLDTIQDAEQEQAINTAKAVGQKPFERKG